jgi:hypothetical protein
MAPRWVVLVDVALLSIVVALFIALVNTLVNALVEVGALFHALFVAPTIFDALFVAPTLFDTLCTLPCALPCIVHRCFVVGEVAMLLMHTSSSPHSAVHAPSHAKSLRLRPLVVVLLYGPTYILGWQRMVSIEPVNCRNVSNSSSKEGLDPENSRKYHSKLGPICVQEDILRRIFPFLRRGELSSQCRG